MGVAVCLNVFNACTSSNSCAWSARWQRKSCMGMRPTPDGAAPDGDCGLAKHSESCWLRVTLSLQRSHARCAYQLAVLGGARFWRAVHCRARAISMMWGLHPFEYK